MISEAVIMVRVVFLIMTLFDSQVEELTND
jgi:hypothetical protein